MLLGRSKYAAASTSVGLQAGVSGNIDIGFWNSWPAQLDGCDYAVQLAGGLFGDLGISVVFQGIPGGDFRFSGVQVDPGAGAEFSAAIVTGCATRTWTS
jgi:hypothetical protein